MGWCDNWMLSFSSGAVMELRAPQNGWTGRGGSFKARWESTHTSGRIHASRWMNRRNRMLRDEMEIKVGIHYLMHNSLNIDLSWSRGSQSWYSPTFLLNLTIVSTLILRRRYFIERRNISKKFGRIENIVCTPVFSTCGNDNWCNTVGWRRLRHIQLGWYEFGMDIILRV